MKITADFILEKAYGGENFYIIGEHIDDRGWINENYLHDPVCVAGYDKEYRVIPQGSYLSDLNYRPVSLRFIDDIPVCTKCQADEAYKYVQKFIDKNREWSDATFGNQSAVSVLKHLKTEVKETISAIENNEGEYAIDMEFADMYLLLLNACSRQGISFAHLHETAINKMQLNRERKWGQPNSDGFVNHIEEDEKLLSSRDYVESVYGTQHFARTVDCRDAESLLDLMDDFADHVRREES